MIPRLGSTGSETREPTDGRAACARLVGPAPMRVTAGRRWGRPRNHLSRGFTLIELLVVIAISNIARASGGTTARAFDGMIAIAFEESG